MRIHNTGGIGPLELGKRSIRKAYLQDDMLMYAAALAYRTFFAFIPFLIFVVALLGVLHVPGFFEWLVSKAQNVLSTARFTVVDPPNRSQHARRSPERPRQ